LTTNSPSSSEKEKEVTVSGRRPGGRPYLGRRSYTVVPLEVEGGDEVATGDWGSHVARGSRMSGKRRKAKGGGNISSNTWCNSAH
jgi:hypothetical protein